MVDDDILPAPATPPVRLAENRARFRLDPPSGLLLLAGALAVLALWLLCRPYLGIIHDSQIYIGRAVADLDPIGVGQELDFVRDRQSGLSVFGLAARPLVALAGPERAAMVLTAAGLLAWLAGAAFLVSRIWRGWGLIAALIMLAAAPSDYGGVGVYHYAEAFATARLFAEAAGLAALGLVFQGRWWLALVLALVALALHPIMAAPVFAVWVLMLAREDRRWLWLFAAGVVGGLAAALAGAPVAARLFVNIDPVWRAVMTERTPDVFPATWPLASWALIACQVATLALAWGARPRDDTEARLCWLIGSVGLVAAASLAGSLGAASLLVVQAQPWRSLWLVSVLTAAAFPYAAMRLWGMASRGRVALALLACAWLLRDIPAAVAVAFAATFAVRYAPREPPRLAVLVCWALAAGLLLGTSAIRLAVSAGLHGDPALGPLAAALKLGAHVAPLAVVAVALTIWPPKPMSRGWANLALVATAVLAVVAVSAWDDRPAFTRFVEGGGRRLTAPRGDLLWVGSFGTGWLASGRPEWWSPFQGGGVVFDRQLALEWARRRDLVRAAGLTGPSVQLTAGSLRSICGAAEGPAGVVAPASEISRDVPALASAAWRAPGRTYVEFSC